MTEAFWKRKLAHTWHPAIYIIVTTIGLLLFTGKNLSGFRK